MKRKALFFTTLAIAVPLIASIRIKSVKGSEPPGRLVDNGDGTVTDTVTHLIWQQASTIVGNQGAAAPTCTALNKGAFASGWRVPTIKELVSIVDYESATAPMIDTAAFPGTNAAGNEPYYTTSTTLCVAFASGQVTPVSCTTSNPVRCVHSPAPPP